VNGYGDDLLAMHSVDFLYRRGEELFAGQAISEALDGQKGQRMDGVTHGLNHPIAVQK